MKFTSAVNSAENLLYGGKLLDKLFTAAPERFNTKTVFPDCTSASLWNAKLFSAQKSMSKSFKDTVEMVSFLDLQVLFIIIYLIFRNLTLTFQGLNVLDMQSELYSMDDLVSLKDCNGILEYRKQLTELYKK